MLLPARCSGETLHNGEQPVAGGTSDGAQLSAGNQLGLAAGNNLTLNAVTDHQSSTSQVQQGHTRTNTSTYDETVQGSTLSGANGVALTTGHDLTATSATLTSANGGVGLMAGHDLTLAIAQENHTTVTDTKTTSSGLLSSSTKRTHDSVSDSLAIGTTISGESVTLAAGHDLTATAAQVVADHGIVMAAGNNLTLNTANYVHTEEHSTSKTKSGLMGAGVGVMVGDAKQRQDAALTQTTPTGTTVGSLGGSVTMTAGNTVHLTNATVLSDTGTAIVGRNVTIDAALGTTDTTQTQKQSSSGLTLSLGGAAVQAAQGVVAAAHRGSEVKDDRLKALYAAQAAYGVSDAIDAAQGGISQSGTDGGINLQLGIGASSTSSKTVSHDETAYGSTIRSNGNVVIAATGGDLNVIGSQISGNNVALAAANNLNLLSQAEQHTDQSSNKNASGGVGIQIGTDGIGFYAQASAGQGSAHGNGTTHTNTVVNANDTLTLISGGDTTIQGAQAKGNTVLANIGGNLKIRSEQDTDDYASKQQQASGKVVVGFGSSAQGSYSQSNIDSHYASVNDISGIGAGNGGFHIYVNGNTDLKGAVIASTADPSKNLLDTGSLTYTNIQNEAHYSASQASISGGSSMGANAWGGVGTALSLATPQSGNSSSTTQAGIANGTIITRNGNTDLSGLDRSPTLDNQALKGIFDQQKIQTNQELGQIAGQVGMHTVGVIANYMAINASTDVDKAAWGDGGAYKTILHGLVGAATAALGGGNAVQGASGAAASEAASGAMQNYLIQQGIKPTDPLFSTMMQLGSAAIGGAVGGGGGAATALQGEIYNRELDVTEKARIKQLANGDPQRELDLDAAACYLVKCYAQYPVGSDQYNSLKALADIGGSDALAGDRALLRQQTTTPDAILANYGGAMAKSLFGYGATDAVGDGISRVNSTYQVGTRVLGGLQAIGGAADVFAGYTLCATGAGCTVGGGLVLFGTDQYQAGTNTSWYGMPQPTLGGYLLQQTGLSPATSELLYGVLGMSPAAVDAIATNRAVNAWAETNNFARLSYTPIEQFGAQGVRATPEIMQTPQARAIINQYLAAGASPNDAILYTEGLLATGKALPEAFQVNAGTELIKLVPKTIAGGDTVGPNSPFFITADQYRKVLNMTSSEIANYFGLPAEQGVRGSQLGFDVYSMTPKSGQTPIVFSSEVAPVQQGGYSASGGGQQILVPNRDLWTDPNINKIGEIKGAGE